MGIFDWFFTKKQQDTQNPTMTGRRAPMSVDMTENIKINGELTRGLLNNSYPGFKLAGALAYAPIMTPVAIMGLPVPMSQSEKTQDLLNAFINREIKNIKQTHISSHGDGTIWLWPWFDAEAGYAKLELILDDSMSDILIDPVSKKIIEIIQCEQISVTDGFGSTKIVDRKRSWTVDRIIDEIGQVRTIYNNPLKALPVPFSNQPDVNRTRGNSDLARIIPDLKVHHDVRLKWVTNLTKMNPKLVQSTNNVGDWMGNNGFASVADINGAEIDFVLNLTNTEKTEFINATGLGAEYLSFLQQNFWQIVQGSSIPELAWGLLAAGNHASTEEQMERLMSYVRDKQDQHTESWTRVFSYVLALESRANMMRDAGGIEVKWNQLDALSEKTKAEIFVNIANAVEKLTLAGVPGEIIHAKLKDFYPENVIESYEEFKVQRVGAAKFNAFNKSTYDEIIDVDGEPDGE